MTPNERFTLALALVVDVVAVVAITWLCVVGRLGPDLAGGLVLGICGAGAYAAARRARPGGPPPSGAVTLALLAFPLLGFAWIGGGRRT